MTCVDVLHFFFRGDVISFSQARSKACHFRFCISSYAFRRGLTAKYWLLTVSYSAPSKKKKIKNAVSTLAAHDKRKYGTLYIIVPYFLLSWAGCVDTAFLLWGQYSLSLEFKAQKSMIYFCTLQVIKHTKLSFHCSNNICGEKKCLDEAAEELLQGTSKLRTL